MRPFFLKLVWFALVIVSFLFPGPAAWGMAPGVGNSSPISDAGLKSPVVQASTGIAVEVEAVSGKTIQFQTQNGLEIMGIGPQEKNLPYLVLFRNGELAPEVERSITFHVSGLSVPPGGLTLLLTLQTQHLDPDMDINEASRITVLRKTYTIYNTGAKFLFDQNYEFTYTLAGTTMSGESAIPTPSDYYRYELNIFTNSYPMMPEPSPIIEDYAFLVENQEVVGLPDVPEERPGAAPDELAIFYCDMFPIQKDRIDLSSRISRAQVREFLHGRLVPGMIEVFRDQSEKWGFEWYEAWTSHRSEERPGRLSVALTSSGTWFHGKAPGAADAGITLVTDNPEFATFDDIGEGLNAAFRHELFHNLQRNISQKFGSGGSTGGKEAAWTPFSEGMAVFATTVGLPAEEYRGTSLAHDYFASVNVYIAGDQFYKPDLNTSYEQLNPYRSALYWRFLYEQCGGMEAGKENPEAGMQLIRRTLEALYSNEIVDILDSSDIVAGLPQVMDHVLRHDPTLRACPFKTFSESLDAYARAIYALRLEDGRCTTPGSPSGCGLYDPNSSYRAPSVRVIDYHGDAILSSQKDEDGFPGIGNSFGIDFVEIHFDPATANQPVKIEITKVPGSGAEFSIQLWQLKDAEDGSLPRRAAAQLLSPELLAEGSPDGTYAYALPSIDLEEFNRIALIITRIDTGEKADPVGGYTVAVYAQNWR